MDSRRRVRKRLRYHGFDYSAAGAYFVTICSKDRILLFGRIRGGTVERSAAGQIVIDTWGSMALHHRELRLDEYVLMPDHFHGIIFIDGPVEMWDNQGQAESARDGRTQDGHGRDGRGPSPTVSIPYLMRELKTFSANKINRLHGTRGSAVWQRSYWERIIRDDRELETVRQYIRSNPEQWESDRDRLGQRLVGDGPRPSRIHHL